MANLRLTLLGGFQARLDSGSSSLILPRRKAEALLAYLALHAGQAQPRDKLAALLWGDLGSGQARHAVRQVLLDLRKALAGVEPPLLLVESDTVRLDAGRVEVDAVLFERLVAEGTPEALQAAAAAYAGDFLAGLPVDEAPFEEWLLAERERLRDLALEALTKLLAHQARTDPSAAVRTATRLLTLDPLQEPVHRALMRLHDEQGRRTTALRQYHVCARLLRRELGIDPEPATRELYETILRADADALVPPATPGAPLAGARGRHRGAVAPLVGREPELRWLRAALAEAWEERGLVAALVGEAGIGKSRLVEELGAEATAAGGRGLIGRCYETERILPFRPWIDALRPARILDDAALWRGMSPGWRAELARLFPELGGVRPFPARSAEDHLRLFEALGEVIVRLAAQRTLLLVLEDLHWADEMSLRLLPFLGRRLDASPILVLVTARDEELEDADLLRRGLEELDGEQRLRRITLSSLSRSDTTRLVQALAAHDQAEGDLDRLGDQVWRLSEGNPLTIVELMRAVQEGDPSISGAPLSLPRRVREIIGHRLHRLSPAAGALVDAAAIVGQEFELALVSQVGELDDQAAATAIEELIRRRILCERGHRLDFAHERIREVARDRLAAPHRRLLHGRVARALEELYAGDLEPYHAALADHYAEAEVWDRAVRYRVCFAETAARRHSHTAAVRALEQALTEAGRLPPRERDRRVLESVVELHMPLVLLGRVSESRELLVRHEEALHRVADPALAGRYYYALGTTEVLMGNPEKGARATRRALAEATRAGDQATIGRAHQALALADFWVGGYREAIEHGSAAVAELEGAGDPYTLGTALWIVALSYTFIGEFQPALEATDRLRAVGEAAAEPRLRCSAAWTRGAIHAWSGDCDLGITACREALELAPDRVSWASAAGWLGFAYLEKGEAGSAFAFLDQAVRQFAESGMPYAQGGFACWLAEAHLLEGRVDAARAVALESLETTRQIRSPHGVGGAHQALGRIARAQGHLREAEAHYEQALSAFASCGARFEIGRSHLILAELAFEQGNGRAASSHLETARAIFEDLGVPIYVARANALAGRLRPDMA